MSAASTSKQFAESTRGQIIALLRHGEKTIEELAALLGVTDNAIRAHLPSLERDGIVRQNGVRRGAGAGKPATLYEIHPDAEPLFSRAYAPVLRALLDELALQLPKERTDQLLHAVGRRLAVATPRLAHASTEEKGNAAAALLNSWGGDAAVELGDATASGVVVRERAGCTLSRASSGHPDLCHAVETLLSDVLGANVRSRCVQGERPRCVFEIVSQASENTNG